MIYLELFLSFLQVGLFSIGGGYAALPLIQHQVVTAHGWLTGVEFADVVTLSQMTPGPISLNAATFVGTRVGGGLGAIVATLGVVMPSVIIVMGFAAVYVRYRGHGTLEGVLGGLRPAVVGLIGSAALSLILLALFDDSEARLTGVLDLKALLMFVTAFGILRRYRPNAIGVMAVCGLTGMLVYGLG
jgi:chromate transporter